METKKPRQFDWLKLHLKWFDKIAPDSEQPVSQERWEELLSNALDRYVVNSSEFMDREIPLSYFE